MNIQLDDELFAITKQLTSMDSMKSMRTKFDEHFVLHRIKGRMGYSAATDIRAGKVRQSVRHSVLPKHLQVKLEEMWKSVSLLLRKRMIRSNAFHRFSGARQGSPLTRSLEQVSALLGHREELEISRVVGQ